MKALEQFIDDVTIYTAVRQISVFIFGYNYGRWNLFIEVSSNIFGFVQNQKPGLSFRDKFGFPFVLVISSFVLDINQSFVIRVKSNSRHSRPRGRGILLMDLL
jgi:hypothetical protein